MSQSPPVKKNYVFGPVPSRRLGLSLGIDIVPVKTCTFDCIYCQVGETTDKSSKRKSFYPVKDILQEIESTVSKNNKIDYITFSGSGEPTLNKDIGSLISGIKKMTKVPVAVITNSSLLYCEDVKQDLKRADLLVPSMDAVSPEVFEKINRPGSDISLEHLLQGLSEIKEWFKGEVRLEVMLVKGVNDSESELSLMLDFIKKIKPDKIELNTVTRPPRDDGAKRIEEIRLQQIAEMFGAVVIAPFKNQASDGKIRDEKELILTTLSRRPMTRNDLIQVTGFDERRLEKLLLYLQDCNLIDIKIQDKECYYIYKRQ